MKNKGKKKKRRSLDHANLEYYTRGENMKTPDDKIFYQLSKMRHRDMQKLAILKGCPFPDIIKLDHHNLISWLYRNWDNGEDHNRLVEYDAWFDQQISFEPNSPFRHKSLRFSYVEAPLPLPESKKKEEPEVAKAAPPVEKEPRVKHKEWDIVIGTKKYMVYQLTIEKKMKNLEKIHATVSKTFPEVDIKSVKIWHQRALKLIKK